GARVGLGARRGPGVAWLLIVPAVGLAAVQAGAVAVVWFVGSAPDVRNPQTFESAAIRFEAPGNWSVVTLDAGLPPSWDVEVHEPEDQIRFDVVMTYTELDLADRLKEFLLTLENSGSTVVSRRPMRVWGPHAGEGAELEIEHDGEPYQYRILITRVAPGVTGELACVAYEPRAAHAETAADLILSSVQFTEPASQEADLPRARTWRNQLFEAEVAGNWFIESWSADDAMGPGADFTAPDGSSWRIISYPTEMSPADELTDTLQMYGEDADRVQMLDQHREYAGLPCVGQTVRLSIEGRTSEFGAY